MSTFALNKIITEINNARTEKFASEYTGTNVIAFPPSYKMSLKNLVMKDGLEIYRYIDKSLSTDVITKFAIQHETQVKGRRQVLFLAIEELESRGFNRPKMVNL